jgi:Asp-tRNA(Asn)/Glu-tRNA(Gln) amidotransferase A subunit family amidase
MSEFASALRAGHFTAETITRQVLDNAEATQKRINAFISITPDMALHQAVHVDELLSRGQDLGPLMGVPIGVKDVFDVQGVPTTAGSRLLASSTTPRSATVVTRLEAAGAVIIGKTNMDQFAFGPHQADFGRTNCPADTTRYAGGRGQWPGTGVTWQRRRRLDSIPGGMLWSGRVQANLRTDTGRRCFPHLSVG